MFLGNGGGLPEDHNPDMRKNQTASQDVRMHEDNQQLQEQTIEKWRIKPGGDFVVTDPAASTSMEIIPFARKRLAPYLGAIVETANFEGALIPARSSSKVA